jgi:signal transduction histidine kinase/CheY-like chemotaxis protein
MTMMPKSISTYLVTVLLTVVTIILFLFFSAYYVLDRDRQMTKLRTELDTASNLFASGLAVPVWNFDEPQINTFMDSFMENRAVAFLELTSRDMKYQRGRDKDWNIRTNIAPDSSMAVLEQERPVVFSEAKIGTVRIGLTQKYVRQELHYNALLMLGIVLLLDSVILASLYLILSRKILKPLKTLDQFAVSVIGGGENRGLIAGRPFMGELETLRSSLIAMMDTLEARFIEKKQLQEQLHQAQKMDVIGQLAGGVAHDFNNMLAAIMASAELIKHRMPEDDRNMKMVNTIINAANRSADLTRDLLSFSRKGTKESRPVAINKTINDVICLLERTLDKSIRLVTLLEAGDPIVLGDVAQLQNALLNLGVNARDAMPAGGILTYATSLISLTATDCQSHHILLKPGNYLQISVSDTGVGISKEIINRIFEPFFTTKPQGKGTGLGLAAVYGTIQDHQGSINVYSEPGNGTVFNVYLPVSSEYLSLVVEDAAIQGSGGVLLVDDEPILLSVGQALLEELGYTVYLAEDGNQALKVYAQQQSHIQMVLLDMIMPGLNGRETLVQLRKLNPDVSVVFCSGFHREGTNDELLQLGAQGFIQKPFSRAALSRIVADLIVPTSER